MTNIEGKVALVTGAGRGIGRAVSLLLGKSGCRVVLAARTGDQLEEVQKEISARGGEALSIPTDLTKDEEINGLVGKIQRTWEPRSILL